MLKWVVKSAKNGIILNGSYCVINVTMDGMRRVFGLSFGLSLRANGSVPLVSMSVSYF